MLLAVHIPGTTRNVASKLAPRVFFTFTQAARSSSGGGEDKRPAGHLKSLGVDSE
jgi:hypothetical protein